MTDHFSWRLFRCSGPRFFIGLCGGWALLALGAADESEIQFNRDIRPILSDKCFKCHGPDAKNQTSPLRLDTYAEATKEHDGRRGIVPRHPESSEVWRRVHTDDTEEVMPPRDSHLTLSDDEKHRLTRWIEQGATYQKH